MAKKLKGDQVITAQLLREGTVVYLADEGQWSHDLSEAVVASSEIELQSLEKMAEKSVTENIVIEAYPMVVQQSQAHITADHIREDMRTRGPSIGYLPGTVISLSQPDMAAAVHRDVDLSAA